MEDLLYDILGFLGLNSIPITIIYLFIKEKRERNQYKIDHYDVIAEYEKNKDKKVAIEMNTSVKRHWFFGFIETNTNISDFVINKTYELDYKDARILVLRGFAEDLDNKFQKILELNKSVENQNRLERIEQEKKDDYIKNLFLSISKIILAIVLFLLFLYFLIKIIKYFWYL